MNSINVGQNLRHVRLTNHPSTGDEIVAYSTASGSVSVSYLTLQEEPSLKQISEYNFGKPIRAMEFSPLNQLSLGVAIGTEVIIIENVLDIDGNSSRKVVGNERKIADFAFSENSSILASMDSSNYISLYDLESETTFLKFPTPSVGTSLTWKPLSATQFVATFIDGQVIYYDIESHNPAFHTYLSPNLTNSDWSSVDLSNVLVSGHSEVFSLSIGKNDITYSSIEIDKSPGSKIIGRWSHRSGYPMAIAAGRVLSHVDVLSNNILKTTDLKQDISDMCWSKRIPLLVCAAGPRLYFDSTGMKY